MFDHVSKSSQGEEATSRTSSQACQPGWMSHWTKGISKPPLKVNEPSLICTGDGRGDVKSGTALGRFEVEDGFSKFGKGVSKYPEEMLISEKKKPEVFKNEICDPIFPTVSQCENIGTTSTIRPRVNPESDNKSLSLALALGREDNATDLSLQHEHNWRPNGKRPVCHPFREQMGLVSATSYAGKKAESAYSHGSNPADASRPVVVFEKHFSNDNFTCFGQDNCKYKKYSSFFIHETGVENDRTHHELRHNNGLHLQHDQSANKNFQSLFYKEQHKTGQNHSTARLFPNLSNIHQGSPHQGSHPPESVPSFRNVETMRICTMVDAVENSPSGHHKVSQRAHHYLLTKETCMNLSNEHQTLREPTSFRHWEEKTFGPFHVSPDVASAKPSGVKIQPLWTSTDSDEKENSGNPSTFKPGSRNEASAESSGMQVEAPYKRKHLSSMAYSPLQDDTVAENSTPAACDSSTEKTSSKKRFLEIPDINEELPGLKPAASSTDGEETSTSRVNSLDAQHIFSYGKQSLGIEDNGGQDHPLGPDTNNRWIKRLKLSTPDSFGVGTKSSDGEGTSHEKFNSFFNRSAKGSRGSLEAKLSKHYSEGQTSVDENEESMVSRKRNQSTMRGCSWIQRWCQTNTAPLTRNHEPLVICEPHSLKIGKDEPPKKHFPSIGALALMGKAMNGVRSCEFKKKGPVMVWNTKEY